MSGNSQRITRRKSLENILRRSVQRNKEARRSKTSGKLIDYTKFRGTGVVVETQKNVPREFRPLKDTCGLPTYHTLDKQVDGILRDAANPQVIMEEEESESIEGNERVEFQLKVIRKKERRKRRSMSEMPILNLLATDSEFRTKGEVESISLRRNLTSSDHTPRPNIVSRLLSKLTSQRHMDSDEDVSTTIDRESKRPAINRLLTKLTSRKDIHQNEEDSPTADDNDRNARRPTINRLLTRLTSRKGFRSSHCSSREINSPAVTEPKERKRSLTRSILRVTLKKHREQ